MIDRIDLGRLLGSVHLGEELSGPGLGVARGQIDEFLVAGNAR